MRVAFPIANYKISLNVFFSENGKPIVAFDIASGRKEVIKSLRV